PPGQQQQCGAPAHIYALDQDQAAGQPGTMSGLLSLFHTPVFALFDTGATRSFISAKCLSALGAQGVSTVDALEISLASGRKIVTSSLAKNLNIDIGGRALVVDAFVIDMNDFDLILGMDWLARYEADIRRQGVPESHADEGCCTIRKKGKLQPRFIGPFDILERFGDILERFGVTAYRLALPPELSGVHNVFHVSMLRKYVYDLSHVVNFDELE
ncbi:Unknown protein, partial [Striga hermonthica]